MVEEELRNLERARDPEARDRPRRMCGDVLAEERDATGLRLQVAGRDVEEGGLAGAVRADDREVLAVDDIEIDAVGRDHAAEADDEPARAEDDVARHPMRAARAATSDEPDQPCRREQDDRDQHDAEDHLPGVGELGRGVEADELEDRRAGEGAERVAGPAEDGDEHELARISSSRRIPASRSAGSPRRGCRRSRRGRRRSHSRQAARAGPRRRDTRAASRCS